MENAKTSAPQWIAQRQVHTGRKHKVKCTGGARKDKCTGSHADGEALFPSRSCAAGRGVGQELPYSLLDCGQ